MSRFRAHIGVWCRELSQGEPRLRADKQLRDLIQSRRIAHDGDPELREHILNAHAKVDETYGSHLRIVKASAGRHVDLAVALSMAVSECLRLTLPAAPAGATSTDDHTGKVKLYALWPPGWIWVDPW